MSFPLISEYKDAVLYAEDNFKELTNLRPVLDDNGEPVMSSGNFAVVFKMEDESDGRYYAMKCFLKEQSGRNESYRLISEELENIDSSYLVSVKYLEKELFVDSTNCKEEEFPVLLMDWIEGQTLDKYIKNIIDDENELSLLAYRFGQLAVWLIHQPFAHGDLKPDNILVRPDGSLVLIDYDGMFVPAMKGQKAREIGSPDFSHPLRGVDDFDEHIDDFSISSIALSLKAIACKPSLWDEFGADDRLLLSKNDYVNIGESLCVKAICSLANDSDISALLGLFYIVCSKLCLNTHIARCFVLNHRMSKMINADDADNIERLFEKKKEEGKIMEFIRYCNDNIDNNQFVGVSHWGLFKACYHLSKNMPFNSDEKVLSHLKLASSYNVLKAKKTYASLLTTGGHLGLNKDTKLAFELFEECAKTNDPDSLCALAICYNEGIGVNRDFERALYFFQKSAELGWAAAQCMLAHWYYHCIFGQNGYVYDIGQKNIDEAIHWYTKAAEQNHHEACWWLSKIYIEEDGHKNIILAKYYSDKVRDIQSSGRIVCKEIQVDDEFNDLDEFIIVSCGKMTEQESDIIESTIIVKKQKNLYVRFELKDKKTVDFRLLQRVNLQEGYTPNKFGVAKLRKSRAVDNHSFYKLYCLPNP